MSNTKVCSKCKAVKPISDFGNHKQNKDGLRLDCKPCNSQRKRKYLTENRELVNEKKRVFYAANKSAEAQRNKEYIERTGYKQKARHRIPRHDAHVKAFKANAKNVICKANYWFHCEMKTMRKVERKKAAESRKPERDAAALEYRRNYRKARRKTDLREIVRRKATKFIQRSLQRVNCVKTDRTSKILGINSYGFKQHMESLFTDGMSWDNRSEWHIDHIIPLSMAKSEDEAIKLNHYTNLRPMWAADNEAKSDSLPAYTEVNQYGLTDLFKEIVYG